MGALSESSLSTESSTGEANGEEASGVEESSKDRVDEERSDFRGKTMWVLCADEESLRNPSAAWFGRIESAGGFLIECCATGGRMPSCGRDETVSKRRGSFPVTTWSRPNVAAALKYDDPCKKVYLACAVNNGSLASRRLAKVDGVLFSSVLRRSFLCLRKALGRAEAKRSITRKRFIVRLRRRARKRARCASRQRHNGSRRSG